MSARPACAAALQGSETAAANRAPSPLTRIVRLEHARAGFFQHNLSTASSGIQRMSPSSEQVCSSFAESRRNSVKPFRRFLCSASRTPSSDSRKREKKEVRRASPRGLGHQNARPEVGERPRQPPGQASAPQPVLPSQRSPKFGFDTTETAPPKVFFYIFSSPRS